MPEDEITKQTVHSPSDARVTTGDVIDDRYSVSRKLAVGGFSTVYEARVLETGEPVALKVARAGLGDAVRRFARESSVLRRISSAYLPRLRGAGFVEEVVPYAALELLDGCTLSHVISIGRPSIAFAVEVTREILEALHAVHREGVVHCDVKPSNLYLHVPQGKSRIVKLLDFGICRPAGSRDVTGPGTPAFMSPEQLLGRALDARADLYATGMVLYTLLTGRPAFAASSPARTADAVMCSDVVPPRALRPACPVPLERLVMRAVCRRPESRYPSATAMLDDLERIAARHDLGSGVRALSEVPVFAAPQLTPARLRARR